MVDSEFRIASTRWLEVAPEKICCGLRYSDCIQSNSTSYTPITKKRSRFLISKDILLRIIPLLMNSPTQFFVDTYFDTPIQTLLATEGIWLVQRMFLNSNNPDLWKLRTSIRALPNEIEWVEYQGEAEIQMLLQEAQLATQSTFMFEFGIPYLTFPTKRYFICPEKVWIDFFGWLTYEEPETFENAGIVAICSISDDCSEDEIPQELKGCLCPRVPNKTLLMLYHQNRKVFNEMFSFEHEISSFPVVKGSDFQLFDQFLGLEKALVISRSDSESENSEDEKEDSFK